MNFGEKRTSSKNSVRISKLSLIWSEFELTNVVNMLQRNHLNRFTIGMWRPLIVVVVGLLSINWTNASSLSNELPCDFLDSINVTAGATHNDGSIVFDGITFPADQIAKVDYILENGKEKVSVDRHIRGCLCTFNRTCLRLCCPHGSFTEYRKGNKTCRIHESAKDLEDTILDENNQTKTVKLNEHFTYVDHRPCKEFYIADEYQITHVNFHRIFLRVKLY